MSKRKKWFIFLGVVIYALGVVVVVFINSLKHPVYFSSPTESRGTPGYEDDSSVGLLEEADWKIGETRPANAVMVEPIEIAGTEKDFVFNWKGETELPDVAQIENWSAGLEGDDEIELVAFATWYPLPEDDISKDANWKATLRFYDAKTLKVIESDTLKAKGVPEDFFEMKPPTEYRTPRVRLLFQSKNMEHVRFIKGQGGDTRTGAALTFNLERLVNQEQHCEHEGEWSHLDMAWLAWHDTPVKFHIQVLTGDLQTAELPQKRGEQVVFGDFLRVQWLAHIDGNVSKKSGTLSAFTAVPGTPKAEVEALDSEKSSGIVVGGGSAVSALIGKPGPTPSGSFTNAETALWIETKQPTDYFWQPLTLFRVSSEAYQDHCGWIRENGRVEWNWQEEGNNDIARLASTRRIENPTAPIKLVFLPKVTELTFEIAGIPDAPNSRDATIDLFEVKLPQITLPENDEDAEDRLLQLIAIATQTGWDISNLWDDVPPTSLPADRTFRNKTPQELLDFYLDVTPKAHVKYDEEEKVIYFNKEEESLWEMIKEKFGEFWYEYGF